MPYNEAQLNGSADFRVGLSVEPVSQDGPGNYTTFLVQVSLQNPNASPSWTNNTQHWSANINGQAYSGSFTIPQSGASTKTRVLDARYINIGHDADGFRPGFQAFASIDTNHSSIGDGTVSLWADAPRIAKRPSAPGMPTFSQVDNESVIVSWPGSADNRGMAIDSYLLRYWEGAEATGPYTDHSTQLNTSRVVDGLKPGGMYTVRIYAHNAAWYDSSGWSDPSPAATVQLPAGVYVSDGSAWVATGARVSDGSTWANVTPNISDGAAWQEPIDI